MIPIKPHYQRFAVEIVTQQAPNKTFTLEVPARTAKQAVEATVNGGAREVGYYDWLKISSGNETTERPPHPGGPRRD
ncbi:hypothetical protein [Microcoleus anatoxicus]|uniref:CpcD n=1 Tax=Microcoleus anatoxicus PTRS2 TaxID=2705321 RepID=A0ABU8YTL3_9CYAN